MRLPLVSRDQMCRIVAKAGFTLAHRKGSHAIWEHPDGRVTTIPVHKGKDLGKGLIKKILDDIGMSVDEYVALRGQA